MQITPRWSDSHKTVSGEIGAVQFGAEPFLEDDELLGQVTYTDLLRFTNGLESQLDELDIPRGSRVATVLHNCALAALTFLAVIASRRVLVPLNPLSTKDELNYMLDRAQCVATIVDPTHARSNDFGHTQRILIADHGRYFRERCLHERRTTIRTTDDRNNPLVGEIVFTSGSTGRPKGVVLSERNLIANAQALAQVYGLTGTDRFLTVCPLFHNSGQVFTTLACALVGGSTAVVKSDIGMLNFWKYVDKYRARWSLGMLSFLALLLARPESPTVKMRGLLTGGSAIDAGLLQQFESRFRVPVRTVYGLTESASIATCEYLDPSPRSLGSSGRPLPICDVRIGADPTAFESSGASPSRERGEIWISGPTIFDSYVGDCVFR